MWSKTWYRITFGWLSARSFHCIWFCCSPTSVCAFPAASSLLFRKYIVVVVLSRKHCNKSIINVMPIRHPRALLTVITALRAIPTITARPLTSAINHRDEHPRRGSSPREDKNSCRSWRASGVKNPPSAWLAGSCHDNCFGSPGYGHSHNSFRDERFASRSEQLLMQHTQSHMYLCFVTWSLWGDGFCSGEGGREGGNVDVGWVMRSLL